jgi:hypothetical protein
MVVLLKYLIFTDNRPIQAHPTLDLAVVGFLQSLRESMVALKPMQRMVNYPVSKDTQVQISSTWQDTPMRAKLQEPDTF